MAVQIELPQQVSAEQLRDVVLGNATTLPRNRAMTLFQASDVADKQTVFETLLFDEGDDARIRYQAALSLYKINTAEARQMLLDCSQQVQNEQVLTAVVKALGRTGDEQAMEVVSKLAAEKSGRLASQAEFAACLISHRLGLAGPDLPVPAEQDYIQLSDDDTHQFQVTQASRNEVQLGLSSLEDEPFGIDYLRGSAYQVECEPRSNLLIFLNRNLTRRNALRTLSEKKALPAVIASKSEESGRYSTAFLVLTSPVEQQADRLNVFVHRPGGQQIFAGTAQIDGDRADFSLRAISRPGVFGVEVQGAFEAGELTLKTALSAFKVQNRGQPTKG